MKKLILAALMVCGLSPAFILLRSDAGLAAETNNVLAKIINWRWYLSGSNHSDRQLFIEGTIQNTGRSDIILGNVIISAYDEKNSFLGVTQRACIQPKILHSGATGNFRGYIAHVSSSPKSVNIKTSLETKLQICQF
jgi:hypothetical protein